MKTVLITGGLGFIGSHLNKNLVGYNIINVDLKNGFDVKNEKAIENVFKTNSIDVIIHLAAIPGVGYSVEHPDEVMENNIKGFDTVAKLAVKYNVPHMVYASSSSVYGDGDMKAKSPYALSKQRNEEQAEKYSKLGDTKFTGLRFFTVYGKNTREDLAIAKFIKSIKNNEELVVYSNGNQSRDFTFVDDVCEVINAIICSNKTWRHEIFDVGYGKSVTINYVINIIKKIINPSFNKIKYLPAKSYDVIHTLSNTTKLTNWFTIKPNTNIEKGLNEILTI